MSKSLIYLNWDNWSWTPLRTEIPCHSHIVQTIKTKIMQYSNMIIMYQATIRSRIKHVTRSNKLTTLMHIPQVNRLNTQAEFSEYGVKSLLPEGKRNMLTGCEEFSNLDLFDDNLANLNDFSLCEREWEKGEKPGSLFSCLIPIPVFMAASCLFGLSTTYSTPTHISPTVQAQYPSILTGGGGGGGKLPKT